jgi:hypothetical protein
MRTMMILLLAASLPAATWAQKGTQAGQGAQMPPGTRYCGHALDAGTFVDARAKNASGEEALVMRWLDPRGTAVHSALFMGRCVAKDGDTIDGKVIVRVLPNSLAVSDRHALTAWEAEYWNYSGEQAGGRTPHRGAFSDSHFVAELDASKASELGGVSGADPDFRWNEEQETLTVKPGILPPPPAPLNYTYAPAAPSNSAQPPSAPSGPTQSPAPTAKPCTPQAQQGPDVKVYGPQKSLTWTCVHLGICAGGKPVVLGGGNGCPAAPATGQPAKQ